MMAHTDWKNREERRGIHDEKDWCAGWITGYLTPNKPSPARITLGQIEEIERLLNLPEHAWDEADYESKNLILKSLRQEARRC